MAATRIVPLTQAETHGPSQDRGPGPQAISGGGGGGAPGHIRPGSVGQETMVATAAAGSSDREETNSLSEDGTLWDIANLFI